MSDINTDILNGLIIGRVEPHIYAFSTRTVPDYLKIGDTYRPIETRLDEWRKYFPNLEKHFSGIAKADAETFFRDFAVHQFLERDKCKVRLQRDMIEDLPHYSNEFFRDTEVQDIQEAIADIKRSHLGNDGKYQFYRFDESRIPIDYKWERKERFEPRPNQQAAIDSFKVAIGKGRTNLLMYAVMRFGKSFTSMCCATEMDARFVVIVSAKADVKAEWKRTVESHIRFEGFEFLDSNSLMRSESAVTDKLKDGKVALFLTLQDLQGEGIKSKHNEVFAMTVDLLLIDETHYGARASEFGRVLDGLSKSEQKSELKQYEDDSEDFDETLKKFNAKIRIHLSGTPYRILMGSEFAKDDIISFCQFTDIVAEQEKWNDENINKDEIKEWDNPYYGFPQMVRFAFNPNEVSIRKMEELRTNGISTAFNELFRPESIRKDDKTLRHKKFKHENEIIDLLEIIDGSKSDNNLLGFLDYDKIKQGKMCRHIVCVLPYRASCDAMEELIKSNLKKFKNLNDYQIINIAGVEDERTYKEIKSVKDRIKSCERENQKTLTLTVNRMLTGTTVEEWDTMIYLKDTSSPQEYDQSIFRLQNQYIATYKDEKGDVIKYNMKPQTLLVDFAPDRMFRMQANKSIFYNYNTDQRGNNELTDRIATELRISPIVHMNINRMECVQPADIIDAVRRYSADRGVNEEVKEIGIDYSLMNDERILIEIARQSEMGSKGGINKRAVEGSGVPLDIPDDDGGENVEAKDVDQGKDKNKQNKKSPEDVFRDKFATYYSRILFFAFLSPSKLHSLEDIIANIPLNQDNKRIAKNLELDLKFLTLLGACLNKVILRELDFKIQNINSLDDDQTLTSIERFKTATRKFDKLGESEIITPTEVAANMVGILPNDDIGADTKFLDIASKKGEFAYAILDAFGDAVKGNIYSITTSKVAYEFTRKVYEILGMPVENIFDEFNSYDIIGSNNEVIIKQLDDMKFNVVVGNPPYQESDGGGRESSATSLYNKFIETLKVIEHSYISMIIPARWYAGGKGLDDFRAEMLNDTKLSQIHDFPETSDCFPLLNIRGGVCYFLREKSHKGNCKIINYKSGKPESTAKRPLLEEGGEIFIRYNNAISILRKVQTFKEDTFSSIVSSRNPFQIPSNFDGYKNEKANNCQLKLYRFGRDGYISKEQVIRNKELINCWKVIDSKASPGGDEYPHQILTKPIISEPNSVCTETYLIIKATASKMEAQNVVSYIQTRFFRFMVSLIKNTQNISKGVYAFVPLQDFSKPWTDAELYSKYSLTEDEIAFIESMIKPME